MTANSGSGAPTLGEMVSSHSQPAPPAPVAPPPAPVIPATASEATARLNELKGSAEWREQYLSGSPRHAKEMRDLQEAIDKGANPRVDRAIAGIMDDAPFQAAGHLAMIGTAEMLRDAGIGDDVIRQTLSNQEITQAERDAVARWKADKMRDSEWVKKYLAGEGEHKRAMMLANIVL